MSGSKIDKIMINIEADVLAEYEGLVVIGTKVNGKYSENLLYINIENLNLDEC